MVKGDSSVNPEEEKKEASKRKSSQQVGLCGHAIPADRYRAQPAPTCANIAPTTCTNLRQLAPARANLHQPAPTRTTAPY
jgi:hypothetical protein